jgi:hypothetical protein
MKRAVAAGVLVAILTFAGTAGVALGATPTERRLQRQVTKLQKDIAALKKKNTEQDQLMNALAAVTFCNTALAADAFQSTWTVLDGKAGGTPVGAQQAVNDAGACQALSVARSPAVPPSLAPFHSLLRILSFSSIFGGTDPFALRVAG